MMSIVQSLNQMHKSRIPLVNSYQEILHFENNQKNIDNDDFPICGAFVSVLFIYIRDRSLFDAWGHEGSEAFGCSSHRA